MNKWDMQRDIMRRSGQDAPDPGAPYVVSDTSMLYVALVAEEFKELCGTLQQVFELSDQPTPVRDYYSSELRAIKHQLHLFSKLVRGALSHGPGFDIMLTEQQAVAIADDVTDLEVVIAGASVACSLPGDRLYEEVQLSNLSKAQEDGTIARDASGKWIKGPGYEPPNMHSVLFPR